MANFARVKALGWNLYDLLASALMNQLDINVSKAINGDDGSSHAPAVQIVIAGAGMKFGGAVAFDVGSAPHVKANVTMTIDAVGILDVANNGSIIGHAGSIFGFGAGTFFCDDVTVTSGGKCKLSSRSITRVSELDGRFGDYTIAKPVNHLAWQCLTANATAIVFPLHVPSGATLTAVSVKIKPPTGHAAFPAGAPATMPNVSVWRLTGNTRVQVGGTTTDTTAQTVGSYESEHALTVGGLTEPVDRSAHRYELEAASEGGANAIASTLFYEVEVTYTTTAYDED